MPRTILIVLVSMCAALPTAAQAARTRQMQVLDRDVLALMEEEGISFTLTTVRSASGEVLLMDQSAATPIRVTALGVQIPCVAPRCSFTDGTSNTVLVAEFAESGHDVYTALSTIDGIRLLSLGDLAATGPLAPAPLASIAAEAGFDPASTRLGIIAVLIGLLVDPNVPAVSYVVGGHGVTLAWIGGQLVPVRFDPVRGVYVEEVSGG